MKNKLTKEDSIVAIRELFNINNSETKSMESNGGFLIRKEEFERYEVISKLQEWFENNKIDGFYIRLSPITLLWTSFDIKPLSKQNE